MLRVNSWRLVECEIVPVSPQGQRAVGLANQMPDREIKVLAVLRINGVVLTAGPYRRYVDARITQLWCAGHLHQDAVAALPGGSRPFRLVSYGGLVRASNASTG
ncbi:hypothetical protein O3Q52_48215 [Streptomyces sp. ActVer]|uniref:hypothetical protein n=1 Tax=Streptomyces sp. ActVer TaxID=3014558 RepID=UPI0022B4ED58|nr:hypothetical protein [Streptomyces sp. ActVer]MCZ4515767.1 hypothetical protein [Streptomyces sp. ActVer]